MQNNKHSHFKMCSVRQNPYKYVKNVAKLVSVIPGAEGGLSGPPPGVPMIL